MPNCIMYIYIDTPWWCLRHWPGPCQCHDQMLQFTTHFHISFDTFSHKLCAPSLPDLPHTTLSLLVYSLPLSTHTEIKAFACNQTISNCFPMQTQTPIQNADVKNNKKAHRPHKINIKCQCKQIKLNVVRTLHISRWSGWCVCAWSNADHIRARQFSKVIAPRHREWEWVSILIFSFA